MSYTNLTNIFSLKKLETNSKKISGFPHKLASVKESLQNQNQGWLTYPFEAEEVVSKINKFAAFADDKYKTLVLLGIGGSALGPKTLMDALLQTNDKEVIFIDNVDPFVMNRTAQKLLPNLSRTLFIIQSKSGKTPETIAGFSFFQNLAESNGLDLKSNFVFVTDPSEEVSHLRKIAKLEGVECFDIPSNIGGRFSVITPIGLLILALIGGDVEKFIQGAKDSLQEQWEKSAEIFDLAKVSFLLQKKGLNELVIMPYSSRLKTFGDWCVQLIAESLGKEFDKEKKVVNEGITPIVAVGATDQHSQLQLFKDGPFNKLILFIEVKNHQAENIINPISFPNEGEFSYLNNQTFSNLIQAEFEATRQSLTESKRANITLSIDKVDEYFLGKLFMDMQLFTAYLGEFMNINTFDQPGVERGKVLTKEILSKKI